MTLHIEAEPLQTTNGKLKGGGQMERASFAARDELVESLDQLSPEQAATVRPFIKSLFEAAQSDDFSKVDINKFRGFFHLERILDPTITELPGVVLPAKDKSLNERIAEGGYNYVHSNITDDLFPVTLDAGPRQLALINFGVTVDTANVVKWAGDNGYELALNDDLLAVGSHDEYGKLQLEYPIIQLGSYAKIFHDYRVSCLEKEKDEGVERGLHLTNYNADWDGDYRFLLVRKPIDKIDRPA